MPNFIAEYSVWIAADQLLLGLGQVERQPVGLGEGADQEEQEADRLDDESPRRGGPAS